MGIRHRIWEWRRRRCGLEIYLKSGQVVFLDGVTNWIVEGDGKVVTALKIEQERPNYRWMAQGTDMRQIDFIVEVP